MSEQVREDFAPRWYSIFFNPYFIIRGRLFAGIKRNAHYIKGDALDFGCGSKPYVSLFNTDTYTGLDFETEVSAQNEQLAADFFYDGKTFPFEDNKFDSVFSSEVLEHVFNPDVILDELHRVMKPGADIVLTCPFYWPEHEQPYDYARYSSFGLKSLFEKHGFEIVHYEKTGSYWECILQSLVLYLNYFIPHKPKILLVLFFSIFITPIQFFGLILSAILPKRIKRQDFYFSNIVVARKIVK